MMRHFATSCVAVMGLVLISDLTIDEARAGLQVNVPYHLQENAAVGPQLQADLTFGPVTGPLLLVRQAGSFNPFDGIGIRFSTFVLFSWTAMDNSTDLFIGTGDAAGIGYFGFYVSQEGPQGYGSFSMDLVQ